MEAIEAACQKIQNIAIKLSQRIKQLCEFIEQSVALKNNQDDDTKYQIQLKILGSLGILEGISKIVKVKIWEQEKFNSDLNQMASSHKESCDVQISHKQSKDEKDKQKRFSFFEKYDIQCNRFMTQIDPELVPDKGVKQQLYFRCNEHPDKILTGISGLRNHLNIHEQKEYLICPDCKQLFSNCTVMANHLREEHSVRGRFYLCPFTNSKISNQSFLVNHIGKTPGYFIHQDIFVEPTEALRLIKLQIQKKEQLRSERNKLFDVELFQNSLQQFQNSLSQ